MKYRQEIDGLRALAVLPVIFFHAGSDIFSGGFVGVDVFFVISGYLITSILISELHSGKFSLVGFYERRARRILPALFVVMFACIPFAWFWMLPNELKEFSKSLVAVSLYVSNILFWSESGYFDNSAELKPLLHTWSLAVEEQFYLLYPLFLFIIWRCGKNKIIVTLVILAVLSLLLAQFGSVYKPTATFYFLPTRGFELIIGALVAFNLSPDLNVGLRAKSNLVNQAMSGLGLLMVIYANFAFDKSTPFPSFYALIPTLGTAFIINFAHHDTFIGRFLGNRLLVGVGLISYSAYLWHQPLFAFVRLRSFDKPSPELLFGLSILAVVLAYLSWKFIERPFRNRQITSRKLIFTASGLVSVMMISMGITGFYSDNFDHRTFADGTTYQDVSYRIRPNTGLSELCNGKTTFSVECRNSDQPEIAVWGDSFAMHLTQGILASNPNAKITQMTWSVCGPFKDLAPFSRSEYNELWAKRCIDFNQSVMDTITKTPSIKYVILASSFMVYTTPDWDFLTRHGPVKFKQEISLQALLDTLQYLKDKGLTPVVFAPPPSLGKDIGHCLVSSKFFDADPHRCDISLAKPDEKLAAVVKFLSEIDKKFKVIWLNQALCKDKVCSAYADGNIIYKDAHLSHEGSAYLGKKLDFYTQIISAK